MEEEGIHRRTRITLHNKSIMESLEEEEECLHQIEGEVGLRDPVGLCGHLQQMGFVVVMINVVVDEGDTVLQWEEEVDLFHWNDLPLLIQAVSLTLYFPY